MNYYAKASLRRLFKGRRYVKVETNLLQTLLSLVWIDAHLRGVLVAVPGGRFDIERGVDNVLMITPATDPGVLTDHIDLMESFLSGRLTRRPGLLESKRHPCIVVQSGHALPPVTAALLANAMHQRKSNPILLAYDPETGEPPANLASLLAFHVALPYPTIVDPAAERPVIAAVPEPTEGLIRAIAAAAARLGVIGHHADTLAVRAASARATLLGRPLETADTEWAIETVLVPRATQRKQQQAPQEVHQDAPAPSDETESPSSDAPNETESQQPTEAVKSNSPTPEGTHPGEPDVLQWAPADESLAELPPTPVPRAPKRLASNGGRFGKLHASRSGRVTRYQHHARDGTRIHVIGTLAAAAPWQNIRPRMDGRKIVIYPQDLRYRAMAGRPPRTHILLIDTSASMWRRGLSQVKAAALECVDSAYQTRARIGIIGMQGIEPTVLLKPGRQYSEASAIIYDLQAGGSTPLVAGLLHATEILAQEHALGSALQFSILTDGRRNRRGRDEQVAERQAIARVGNDVQRYDVSAVVYGAGGPALAEGELRSLAEILGGVYVRLGRQTQAKPITPSIRDRG